MPAETRGAGDPAAGGGGACPVLHMLNYDEAGHYVGERQVAGVLRAELPTQIRLTRRSVMNKAEATGQF